MNPRIVKKGFEKLMTLNRREIVMGGLCFVVLVSLIVAVPVKAAISFRAAASANNAAGSGTLTIAKPTGTQTGDFMLAVIGVRNTPGTTTPSGWTLVGFTSYAGVMQQFVYYRFATSADTSVSNYSWSLGSSQKAAGGIVSYSGVDTSDPINAWQGTTNTASVTLSSPNVSTTVPNTMVVNAYGIATTAALTGNKTERYEESSAGGGQASSKITVMAQEHFQANTGTSASSGNANTDTQADSIGQTIALTPAPSSTLTQSAYRWFTNVDAANFSTVTNNPTTGTDAIYAATNDTSHVYTAGYVSSNGNDWRIEKRNLTDGTLVSGFGTSGVIDVNISANDDRAWGIDQDASAIYISGQDATSSSTNTQWRIEKRDKTTGALVAGFGSGGVIQVNPTSSLDNAKELKVDDSYLYIVGYDNTGAGSWRIEKRDKTTGALVSGFGTGGVIVTDYAATVNDEATSVVLDASSLYIGGFDRTTGSSNSQWRIEKRDKTTGALVSGFGSGGAVTANPFTGNAGSVIEDGVVNHGLVISGGFLYATGSQGVSGSTDMQWRIEKRDMTTGALVSGFGTGGVVNSDPGTNIDNPTSIRADGTSLYVAGFDRTQDAGMSQWRIEKRDMTTGALVSGFGTGGIITSNPSTNHDEARDLVVSGNNIVLVGYDVSPGNYQMRIEKRNTINGNGPSDHGEARSALNTPATSVAQGEKVRLRFLLRVGTSQLGVSDQSFRLQFAERSGTCDAGFSGESYATLTGNTAFALYNNANLSDSSTLYMNVNDPTDGANPVILQAYDEFETFTNSSSSIPVSSNGLWDISITNYSAPLGKTYCFRVVDSGGTPIAGYEQIAELSTPPPPTVTQANYRWFQNTNTATPGSPLAGQDSAATVATSTPVRLRSRVAIDGSQVSINSQSFKIQTAERSGVCDAGFSGETYQDIAAPTVGSYVSATAAVNDTFSGTSPWTNVGSVYASDDTTASVSLDTSDSNYLKATGFGFAIPTGATIMGVEVRVEAKASGISGVYISNARVVKNGVISSTTLPGSGTLTGTDALYVLGGQVSTGGASLTPSDVNNSNFGAAVSVIADAGGAVAEIDHITMRVHYYTGSEAIVYHNNGSLEDGATMSSTVNDPTNGARSTVMQSYQEGNPFSNNVAAIASGNDGLWDFALTSGTAADGKTYCLRVVKQDGSLLDTYSQIPEITVGGAGPVTPTLNQMLRGGQSVIDGVKRGFLW